MRKIYPPPFNKFLVFVFYGLLSIAVIISAQTDGSSINTSNECSQPLGTAAKLVIGYVKPDIGPDTIQWDSYDFINVIADDLDDIQNGKFPTQIPNLISKKKNTKVLLSIRNYDLAKWDDKESFYGVVVGKTADFIRNNNLDGVDIEYPGMRGVICKQADEPTWTGEEGKFITFAKNMRKALPDKQIMLTVGSIPIAGLSESINYLNIETYHYSLYENLRNPVITPENRAKSKSYANSPYPEFKKAYDFWAPVVGVEKIIMGLDFGNTIQAVAVQGDQDIKQMQSIEFYTFPSQLDIAKNFAKGEIIPIKNLCSGDNSPLFRWPWKSFSISVLDSSNYYCTTKTKDWTRKFDSSTSTSWLYRNYDLSFYYFVSYEDFNSIRTKLFQMPMGGISISDVSYDDDNNSLLKYIRGGNPFSIKNDSSQPGNSSNSNNNNNSKLPNAQGNNILDNKKPSTGAIIGGVLGSLVGLLLLATSCFIWYRQKSFFLKSKNAGGIPKGTMRSHTTPKNPEMASEPSPNRFATPTTVIPVASGYVTAMFDFTGKEENDLSFKKGDKIEVLERGDGPNDWWVGRVNGVVGEFPGNYVKET